MINPIKKFLKVSVAIIVLCGSASFAFAMPQDTYQFATKTQQQNFAELTQEFRCLVCQNESLADSNAALARDLRKQITSMLQQGASKAQIKKYLVQRYGQFILFKPPFEATTYLLWLGPFALLIMSIAWLLYGISRRKPVTKQLTLTAQDQQRLQHLLANSQD